MESLSNTWKLTFFSSLIALISLVGLIYIVIAAPPYLRKSSEGTPFFTPPVLHPDTGEQITIDELVRHYKSGSDND